MLGVPVSYADHLALRFLLVCAVVLVALAFIPSSARAGERTPHERLVAAIASRSNPDDHVDPEAAALAIEAATPDRDWQSLLVSVATHESHFSARLAAGACKPWECDPKLERGVLTFRALGLFQQHKNLHNAKAWASTDLTVQTASALDLLRRSYWECRRGFRAIENWQGQTLNAFAGKACTAKDWSGLEPRLATYNRVRRELGW